MRDLPQQHHCDLGLVDDDHTPDMRTPPAATRGDLNEPNNHAIKREKEF
ncbi:hypothetical protein QYF68_26880 [Mycolicibacterium austroafricanum]|uniref:Uncharacterized protein n=1 Tax=Mycolicibacterium austroafricanum TaxID=39687 RepID=A0ABT8HLJ2_MYCAO|nr:hypothetical protein [Mycolicibacterium austroafricanum]MDN4521420.1 hypothetical protein [Mycolicibacterium austroafricanum]